MSEDLLIALLSLPFILGMGCFLLPLKVVRFLVIPAAVVLASLAISFVFGQEPGVYSYNISGWAVPLGIRLHIDGFALVMILLATAVFSSISVYSLGYFEGDSSRAVMKAEGFWPLLYILWGSLQITFLTSDLFTLYICLEMISLSAVAAIALEPTMEAYRAATRYLMTVLLGSLAYLLGVALIYAEFNTLDWRAISVASQEGSQLGLALSLLTVGLLLKSALFPLHFWLPKAHSAAPAPVSALLSALVVKASFYILLRIWILAFPNFIDIWAAHGVGVLGAGAVLWGSYQAIIQSRLKLMVAYSTVAQIGYLFLAFPLLKSLYSAEDLHVKLEAWNGVIFFILAHALAKSAFFLVSGIFMKIARTDVISELKGTAAQAPIATLTWALAGISLIGLPPSAGFLAKWMILTSAIRAGQWLYAIVIMVGGLMASIYVFRVLWYAFMNADEERSKDHVPLIMPIAGLALALLLVILGVRTIEVLDLLRIGSPFDGVTTP